MKPSSYYSEKEMRKSELLATRELDRVTSLVLHYSTYICLPCSLHSRNEEHHWIVSSPQTKTSSSLQIHGAPIMSKGERFVVNEILYANNTAIIICNDRDSLTRDLKLIKFTHENFAWKCMRGHLVEILQKQNVFILLLNLYPDVLIIRYSMMTYL